MDIYEKTLNLLNPKLYLIKFTKVFICEGGLFLEFDQKKLENFLIFLFSLMNLKDLSDFLHKNAHIVEEIVNSYLEQSFGNHIFTKFVHYFTQPCFDHKTRRSSNKKKIFFLLNI